MSNVPNDHYTLTKWMSQRMYFKYLKKIKGHLKDISFP